MATHVGNIYIGTPPAWTAEQFKQWATRCGTCGNLCRRYRWIGGKVGAYRCADCDECGEG